MIQFDGTYVNPANIEMIVPDDTQNRKVYMISGSCFTIRGQEAVDQIIETLVQLNFYKQ